MFWKLARILTPTLFVGCCLKDSGVEHFRKPRLVLFRAMRASLSRGVALSQSGSKIKRYPRLEFCIFHRPPRRGPEGCCLIVHLQATPSVGICAFHRTPQRHSTGVVQKNRASRRVALRAKTGQHLSDTLRGRFLRLL